MSRVRHHADLKSLQNAAENGCEVCLLIYEQALAMLAELETSKGKKSPYSPPSFDMSLSQRPDGGQGFWVWSAPISNTIRAEIAPVAAFTFVVAEEHPFAGNIRGRPAAPNLDAQALQPLSRWLANCEQHHECCRSSGLVPRRLIDVRSTKSDDLVKIIEPDDEACLHYAALSYDSNSGVVRRWGNTILSADEHVSTEELPKLFQDAIFVTRTSGLHYLWIDSLCIPSYVQEWSKDSEEFGSVYENAHLTLSATGSETTADSLFPLRPTRVLAQVPYTLPSNATELVSASVLPLAKDTFREDYIEMKKEPISRGVWPFQERVLSRRVVHFATDQMYFECMHHFSSGDGLLERFCYHSTVDTLPEGTSYYRKRAIADTWSSRWFALLWDYGQRLSHGRSDKLKALANVARIYQRMTNDDYIVGHWKQSLLESLCWQSLSCTQSGENNAPSWSWVSVDGIPAMGFTRSSAQVFPTIILDTRVTLLDEDQPFGSVAAAEISLEAPLVPLKLIEKPGFGEDGHMFLCTHDNRADEGGIYGGFDTIDRRFSQSAETVRNMQIFAIPVVGTRPDECETGLCYTGVSLHVLLVTPRDESENIFRRVGYTTCSPKRLQYNEPGLRRTLVLV